MRNCAVHFNKSQISHIFHAVINFVTAHTEVESSRPVFNILMGALYSGRFIVASLHMASMNKLVLDADSKGLHIREKVLFWRCSNQIWTPGGAVRLWMKATYSHSNAIAMTWIALSDLA